LIKNAVGAGWKPAPLTLYPPIQGDIIGQWRSFNIEEVIMGDRVKKRLTETVRGAG
jgi:hypothetical protein